MKFYPLLFKPVYRDYLWGGDQIPQQFSRSQAPSPCAESWEISAHPDGMSIIENGDFAGQSLAAICQQYPQAILGSYCADGTFPILIKLIDAKNRLSVQVHPDENGATQYGGEPKTEMWYILDAPANAFVCAGLKPGVGPRAFHDAIQAKNVASTLRTVPAIPGKAIFIPGGLVHAICEGCLILEVQQSSNTTYRVYDWDRTDAQGNPRTLHVKQAMEVIDWHAPQLDPIAAVPMTPSNRVNQRHRVLRCDFFTLERFTLEAAESFTPQGTSFRALFAPQDAIQITWEDQSFTLPAGRSCLIPAQMPPYTLSPTSAQSVVLSIEV